LFGEGKNEYANFTWFSFVVDVEIKKLKQQILMLLYLSWKVPA